MHLILMLIKLDSWQLATNFSWYIVVYRIGCALADWSDACRSLGCDAFLAQRRRCLVQGSAVARGGGGGSRRRRTAVAIVVYAICAYQLSGTRSLLNMNWITRPGIDRALLSEFTNFIPKLLLKRKQKFVNRYFSVD